MPVCAAGPRDGMPALRHLSCLQCRSTPYASRMAILCARYRAAHLIQVMAAQDSRDDHGTCTLHGTGMRHNRMAIGVRPASRPIYVGDPSWKEPGSQAIRRMCRPPLASMLRIHFLRCLRASARAMRTGRRSATRARPSAMASSTACPSPLPPTCKKSPRCKRASGSRSCCPTCCSTRWHCSACCAPAAWWSTRIRCTPPRSWSGSCWTPAPACWWCWTTSPMSPNRC